MLGMSQFFTTALTTYQLQACVLRVSAGTGWRAFDRDYKHEGIPLCLLTGVGLVKSGEERFCTCSFLTFTIFMAHIYSVPFVHTCSLYENATLDLEVGKACK
jgi:hypothetical protein